MTWHASISMKFALVSKHLVKMNFLATSPGCTSVEKDLCNAYLTEK